MDLEYIKGVGSKSLQYLNKMNLYTVSDLIEYYPYRYNVIKVVPLIEAGIDETVTIKGLVDTEPKISYIKKKLM